ncbi:hypothetical protein [Moorena sp. SIO3H5]|nr:hypothetical protein [Moorena sp. SIO3H5]
MRIKNLESGIGNRESGIGNRELWSSSQEIGGVFGVKLLCI